MNSENLLILESKLRYLGSIELLRGLALEEKVVWEKLYREYVEVRENEIQFMLLLQG